MATTSPMKICCSKIFIFVQVVFYFIVSNTLTALGNGSQSAILVKVDQSGKGHFKRIQDAINAIPSRSSRQFFIRVGPGIYKEKIVVPVDKPSIILSGFSSSKTIITWNQGGGLLNTATLSVFAHDFVGANITIENTYGKLGPAIALRNSGDRVSFYGCSIRSYQDSLLDDAGHHYYKNCYIEGATDFICGNAASVYEKCHIHSIHEYIGNITAQARSSPSQDTGFTFLGCSITGVGRTYLGRPWKEHSRVVFAKSYLSNAVMPQGWNDWGNPKLQRTVFFGEYNNKGPGAAISARVKWSHQLSNKEAMHFLSKDRIGGAGWLKTLPTKFEDFKFHSY